MTPRGRLAAPDATRLQRSVPSTVPLRRARRAFVEGPWMRRFERLTGAVLVGLGVRLALERR
jgi:threonine/homoserine/homoserine lactone efflux protein